MTATMFTTRDAAQRFTITVPASDPRPTFPFEAWAIHYEAIGASRELARGQLPALVVRQRVAVARDPRRVHLLRCMTRRPRLSLLERVRGMR